MEAKSTIENHNGAYALFTSTGSAEVEVERYDTRTDAEDAMVAGLGEAAETRYVIHRADAVEVSRIVWPGAPKAASAVEAPVAAETADKAPKAASK